MFTGTEWQEFSGREVTEQDLWDRKKEKPVDTASCASSQPCIYTAGFYPRNNIFQNEAVSIMSDTCSFNWGDIAKCFTGSGELTEICKYSFFRKEKPHSSPPRPPTKHDSTWCSYHSHRCNCYQTLWRLKIRTKGNLNSPQSHIFINTNYGNANYKHG